MKLTPWFPGTVKPVRVGVYERIYDAGSFLYCSWNGEYWGPWARTPEEARKRRLEASLYQDLPWRGVLK
jgi:hypothetical protein